MNLDIPQISVVITCFNYGHYLDACIRSVLSQSYDNYEIIVIDDGSTDHTSNVMNTYAKHPKVTYIRQENSGQTKAKNVGIKNSKGRYIAFLDADDLWHRDKLAKQIRLFENPSVGVVYSRATLIDARGDAVENDCGEKYLLPRSGRVSRWLIFDNFVSFSSSVVRAECFRELGVFDESLKMGIDWDLWLRLSPHYEFDFVDEPLIHYRVGHAGQMSKNADVRRESSDRIFAKFLECYPNALDRKTIREARSYTLRNKAYYFKHIDKRKSYKLFLSAIRLTPYSIDLYKIILKYLLVYK